MVGGGCYDERALGVFLASFMFFFAENKSPFMHIQPGLKLKRMSLHEDNIIAFFMCRMRPSMLALIAVMMPLQVILQCG